MMKRVGLIFGSRSVEHEISITTASKVYEALRQLQGEYEILPIYLGKTGAWLTGPPVERLLAVEAEGRACREPARRKALQEDYKAQLQSLERGGGEAIQQFLAPDPTVRGLTGDPERASWFRRRWGRADIAFPSSTGTHGRRHAARALRAGPTSPMWARASPPRRPGWTRSSRS
jgi:D-alanine-D-alanine ligase-like ATP-grasp enzyme